MPKFRMLIGLPGSGKSTWIKNLPENEEFVVISSDDIIEAFAKAENSTYSQVFSKYAGKANKMMWEQAKVAFENDRDVVWDQTNMSVKSRKKKIGMVPEHYEKHAVTFICNDAELKRRLDNRKVEEGKDIPPHVIKSMANSYNAPTKDEGFDEIIEVRS